MLDLTATTHYDAECFDIALSRISPEQGSHLAMNNGVPVIQAQKPDLFDRIGLAKRVERYIEQNLHFFEGPRKDSAVLRGLLHLATHPTVRKHAGACAQLRSLIQRIDTLTPERLARQHVHEDGQQLTKDNDRLRAEIDQYDKRWKKNPLGYNKKAPAKTRYPDLELLLPWESSRLIARAVSGRYGACLMSPRELALSSEASRQLGCKLLTQRLSDSAPLSYEDGEPRQELEAKELDYSTFCAEREQRYAAHWAGAELDLDDLELGYRSYRLKQDHELIQSWWGVSRSLRNLREAECQKWRRYHHVDLSGLRAFWYDKREGADLLLPVEGEPLRIHSCFWPCDGTEMLVGQTREVAEQLVLALYECDYSSSLSLVRLLHEMGLDEAAQQAYDRWELPEASAAQLCKQLRDIPECIEASKHYDLLAPDLPELRQISGHRRPFGLEHMLRLARRDDLTCSEADVWSSIERYAFKFPERRCEILSALRFENCTREWIDDCFGDFSRGHFLLSEEGFKRAFRAARAPRMLPRTL